MAVVMLMEWPGVTREEYDRVMDGLGLDANPPEGGIFHVAGEEGGSWRVLDIWESEDAWNRFFESRLQPVLQEAGLTEKGQPDVRVYRVHNVYAPSTDALERLGASSSVAGAAV